MNTSPKQLEKTVRKLSASLLLSVSLLLTSPMAQSGSYSRDNIFLEMMRTMLEIMGVIDDDDDYNNHYPNYSTLFPFNANSMTNPQWQNWMQMLAMQQMLSGYSPAFPGGNSFLPGMTGMPGLTGLPAGLSNQTIIPFLPNQLQTKKKTSKPHWIEGKWIASDGMVMEVRRGYFKMYYRDKPRQVRGGLIRLKDKWLAIYEKSHNFSRQYEFAYQDERLALRDTDGNLMLFKKLPDWGVPLR